MPKNTINKLGDLYIAESFLQINFVKGYKYIDRAGEIINYFHNDEKKAPNVTDISPNRLLILNPDEKTQEVRVSHSDFWAHFVSPDTLEVSNDNFRKKAEDVIRIIEAEEISRIGWRNYFVYEFDTEEKRDNALSKFTVLDNFTFNEVSYGGKMDSVLLNLRIRKVAKKVDDSEQQKMGVLIDVDFYKKYDNFIPVDKISQELISLKTAMRSEKFLGIVNIILESNVG